MRRRWYSFGIGVLVVLVLVWVVYELVRKVKKEGGLEVSVTEAPVVIPAGSGE